MEKSARACTAKLFQRQIINGKVAKWHHLIHLSVRRYDLPQKELDAIFDSINGLYFTGGNLALTENTTYYKTAKYLWDKYVSISLLPLFVSVPK